MEYRVTDPLIRIDTTSGVYTLCRGQLVNLPSDIGLQLYRAGKVKPVTIPQSCEYEPLTCSYSNFCEQFIDGNIKRWVECLLHQVICGRQNGDWWVEYKRRNG
jgi:hypothetical protein